MDFRDNGEGDDGTNREIDGFGEPSPATEEESAGSGGGGAFFMAERLRDAMFGEEGGDLLLQNDDRDGRVVQWLRALHTQVVGACRADERLKPLLKLNSASGGGAEDPLLAHLSQHFEPSEVGMLARCLCMPLVSVRVGKVVKQGTTLCPTSIRGNLNLALLPTSGFRMSFVGDNGQTERLVTVSGGSQNSYITIEEISEDTSGRSFLVNVSDRSVFYFWCSEKSKLLGAELLGKMRDLLQRRPSIADLTGVSESRLEYFATHLRGYLLGSAVDNGDARYSGIPLSDVDSTRSLQSQKSLRARHSSNQAARANLLCQGSLSPRISSFKEGLPRSLSMRNARDKLRKLGENHLSAVENLSASLPMPTYSSCFDDEKSPESTKFDSSAELCFLESLGGWKLPPASSLSSQVSSDCRPVFAPCYCWCPPSSSVLKPSVISSGIPGSLKESSLPSLSPLVPMVSSSLLIPSSSISLANLPLELPVFLPDRLPRLPMPSSQPVPTFTPLICDPIVHIPVIDVCSAGQGYLVSAGPGVTAGIAPKLINPLIPETNSVLEESARETLRLLISSSGSTSGGLAGMLSNGNDVMNAVVAGSKGLYHGRVVVDALSDSLASMGLASESSKTLSREGWAGHVDDNEEKGAEEEPEGWET
ncbi:hypothetical protein MLD38_024139 [Melastoma candidum]|uniref:Uncharacterized protein n=2 Tax=Melastoma candidum TaxID=119954 RepID=A0ACB9NY41_9MYRT|nr:hypothetical protein MLD38_024139 [Melastoma candidum]